MKIKLFCVLFILALAMPVYAFEDYVMISNYPIRYVNVQDDEILTIRPVSTIDNEKKLLILTPKKAGKTKINVFAGEEVQTIKVKITESTTEIEHVDGFAYYVIDKPYSDNGDDNG